MHARIAWGVVALAVIAVILDTAFTAAHRPLLSEATWADHGWPLISLAGAGCALMGALIISRYPKQPLGWLLSAASLISVTLATEAYSVWVLDGDGPGSPYWAHVSGWVSSLLGWPAFTALIMVFLISPDGHLLSPGWRWAARVAVIGLALHTLGTLTINPRDFVYGEEYGTSSVSGPLLVAGVALVGAGLVASAVSLVLRLKRARDEVRRQLLWIASSAAFLAFGVVVVLAIPPIQGQEGTWLAALPLHLAYFAVPFCVAVAVLRHRLVAIDLIVNRALVLALATGLVVVGYVLVVVVVGLAVGSGTGGFWPSLLATALVAMAFQPLRRRVVRTADRLAFGPAAAPYAALADFSRRLADSPDPSTLLPTVADAAAHAVNASGATAVLHGDAGPDRLGVWPPSGDNNPAASSIEMPVLDRGDRLGTIAVTMPAGHPLRPREQRLLADLADQAGMAFRNARLTAELSHRVDQLGYQTRELTESRRRLITASDAERSRLEGAINEQVLLHLVPLPARLRRLHLDHHAAAALDTALLGQMVNSLNAALESLREITRGVYPVQLVRAGLPTALGSLVTRAKSTCRLIVDDSAADRRFDPRVEAAAYFCVAETTRDLGTPIVVTLNALDDQLQVVVSGRDRRDLSLSDMRDRVEAAGGSVSMTAEDGHVAVEVRLPVSTPRPMTVS